MKRFMKKTGIALLLASITSAPTWADDVEIYFNTVPATAGDPLVMFSIDWRPSLGSNICNIGGCAWEDYWDGDPTTPAPADYNEHLDALAQAFTADDTADGTIVFFEMLRAALRVVLDEVDDVKVGLMLNHNHNSINSCTFPDDGTNTDCSNGGYIAMGFQEVDGTASTTGGDDVLLNKLAALPIPTGALSHKYQGAELYFEFFRYLTGQGVYNGYNGRSDYDDGCAKDNLDDAVLPTGGCTAGSNVDVDVNFNPATGLAFLNEESISWDTDIIANDAAPNSNTSDDVYVSPFASADTECSGVYAINMMFGVSQQENDSDAAIDATKAAGGMDQLGISSNTPFFDTISWMYGDSNSKRDLADGTFGTAPDRKGYQNVTSYFLYKGNVANTMNGYAAAGGSTQAIEVTNDPSELISTLVNIFEAIKRQNSTFEAPAVTVNSYSSLTHRDELYYALFAPELTPDWPGNLKKYKLIEVPIDKDGDGTTDYVNTVVGDKDSNPAVAEQSELFLPTACSFWSDCTVDRDDPPDGDADPDGDTITWGGAAQELTVNRNIYTDTTGDSNVDLTASNNEVHENTAAITAAMLGIDTSNATDMDSDGDVDAADVAAQRQRLLRLARGVDPDTPTTALQTLGDPIHSRPSVIEYDCDTTSASGCNSDNPDLAIAMTTNEGYFHLFNEETGAEYFAYIPEDLLPMVGKIHGPTTETTVAGGGTAEGPNRFHTYGLDASPVIWSYDFNQDGDIDIGTDHVWAFLSQRRGGSNIYALDITNRNSPKLMWKIEGARDYNITHTPTAGFELLGQTWSEPTKAVIMIGGEPTPVLIFGGGYDDIKASAGDLDHDDGFYFEDGKGRAIYVVNAETGALIWTISKEAGADLTISQMKSGIPAKLRLLDIDNDHIVDRLYAVDIVGRVFRVDFDTTTDTNNTAIHGGGMIAALYDASCTQGVPAAGVALSCQRRFYNAPDVALMVGYPVSPYVQISVGSGYRPYPVSITGIQNRFYTIMDTNVVDPVDTADYPTKYQWTASAFANVTNLPDANATYAAAESAAQALLMGAGNHGWYFDLDSSLNEQVLSESVTLQGYTFFSTYLRDPSQVDDCSVDLGQGRLYIVNAFSGLPAADLSDTGDVLGELDGLTNTDRYMNLDRTGIAADPLVVFRENSEGKISPVVVVGSDLPLDGDSELLEENDYTETWWIDVD